MDLIANRTSNSLNSYHTIHSNEAIDEIVSHLFLPSSQLVFSDKNNILKSTEMAMNDPTDEHPSPHNTARHGLA